jgi:hypothetical protein
MKLQLDAYLGGVVPPFKIVLKERTFDGDALYRFAGQYRFWVRPIFRNNFPDID